jgi:hypothetical protein
LNKLISLETLKLIQQNNMKKLIVSIFVCCYSLLSIAEEGMLIPSLIAAFESDMKAKGMKLTAEQIYSINKDVLLV